MANYLADDDNVDDHYELNLTFPYPNFVLTLCNLLTLAGVHCQLRPSQQQADARGSLSSFLPLPLNNNQIYVPFPPSTTHQLTFPQVLRWMKAHAADPKQYILTAPQ